MSAAETTLGTSVMVDAFRDFHAELVRLREMASRNDPALMDLAAAADPNQSDAEQTDTPTARAGAIGARLTAKLDSLGVMAERSGGAYAGVRFKDAQYVMAALADESFLHFVQWDGRKAWGERLLETRLFGTFVAGERIFQRIEALLAKRDPADRELAAVYLLALALGFRGRFVGQDDRGKLEGYRQDLYTFVNGQSLAAEKGDGGPLFDQSYLPPLNRPATARLPYVRKWIIACILVVVLFGLAQHGLWVSSIAGLEKMISISSTELHGGFSSTLPPVGD
ncbi:MAG: DotU family type IV/VI secretion system protein [Magnetovibrionaceae bacterium]